MIKRNTRPSIRLSSSEVEAFYKSLELTGMDNISQALKVIVLSYPAFFNNTTNTNKQLELLTLEQQFLSKKIEELNRTVNDQAQLITLLKGSD